MKKFLIFLLLIAVVVVIVVALSSSEGDPAMEVKDGTSMQVPAPGHEGVDEMIVNGDNLPPATSPDGMMEDKIHTVTILDSGYEPKELTIKKGDMVIWFNEGSRTNWPASASHPSHTVYPESGGCIGSAFDACKGLLPGEEYSFQFNETGNWGYHNHLGPSKWGRIIVE